MVCLRHALPLPAKLLPFDRIQDAAHAASLLSPRRPLTVRPVWRALKGLDTPPCPSLGKRQWDGRVAYR